MMSGQMTAESMMGGTARKVMEITARATRAAVEIDRSLDSAEIAIASGNFDDVAEDETQINACLQFTITDPNKYVDCAKRVIGQQFAYLSKNPKDSYLQENLYQSFISILDILNGNAYKNVSQCDILSRKDDGTNSALRFISEDQYQYDEEGKPTGEQIDAVTQMNKSGGIAKNPCCNWSYPANKHNIGVNMSQDLNSARQCSLTLSSRLDKVKWFIEKEDKTRKEELGLGNNFQTFNKVSTVNVAGNAVVLGMVYIVSNNNTLVQESNPSKSAGNIMVIRENGAVSMLSFLQENKFKGFFITAFDDSDEPTKAKSLNTVFVVCQKDSKQFSIEQYNANYGNLCK
jgi:hypothetical protein